VHKETKVQPKKIIYFISKIALLDELIGLIYWAFSIYGIFLIIEHSHNQTFRIIALILYILAIAIIYLTLLKKIKYYFKKK